MNILIVTHFYEIDGVMGSVRWTSFAHRLAKKHNVYVVTHHHNVDQKKEACKENDVEVIYIDNECNYVKSANDRKKNVAPVQSSVVTTAVKKKRNALKEIIRSVLYMLSMQHTARKNAKAVCRSLKEKNVKIDYVISTSRPFINCFTAEHIAKEHNAKWLLDQRDLPYSDGASNIEIASYKFVLRRMDKWVSKYTLVSKGMADSFIEFCKFGKRQKEKTVVLNNGYDTSHKTEFVCDGESKTLSIAYAGDLYEGKRDATILFDALRKVVKDDRFHVSDVKIDYAGNSSNSLYMQAEKYGLEETVYDRGRVPHKEAIKMQQEADLLLLLTWNTHMDRGILPGKLYEYMMAQKPIVCITSGEILGGEAEGMVKQMNLGVAVNYVQYTEGVKALSEYISQQLLNKRQGKPLVFAPDTDKVQEFDYDNLLHKLESIMA